MTFGNLIAGFKRIFSPLAGAAMLLPVLLPAPAHAQPSDECDVRFAQDSATIAMLAPGLGLGQQAIGEQTITVTLAQSNNGDDDQRSGTCQIDLRLSRLTSDPSFPDYRLTASGRALEAGFSETVSSSQNQIIVTVPSGRSGQSINLQASVPAEWGTRAGRYNEQLQLALVGASGEILDRLALNLELDIPKAVDVMFVGATGTGQTSRVDLGALSATEPTRSPPFGLRVWSSSGYKVDISSENGGNLAHLQAMDAIPYQLEIDGRDVALSAAPAAFTRANATSRSGDLFRLGVFVPARRSVAGEYQDRITVSVSSI